MSSKSKVSSARIESTASTRLSGLSLVQMATVTAGCPSIIFRPPSAVAPERGLDGPAGERGVDPVVGGPPVDLERPPHRIQGLVELALRVSEVDDERRRQHAPTDGL